MSILPIFTVTILDKHKNSNDIEVMANNVLAAVQTAISCMKSREKPGPYQVVGFSITP